MKTVSQLRKTPPNPKGANPDGAQPIAVVQRVVLIVGVWLMAPLLTYGQSFEERANQLLQQYADNSIGANHFNYSKYAFWYAQAKFNQGKTDEALEMVALALDDEIANEGQASFRYWSMIDCYLRWQDQYPEALKIKTQQKMTSYPGYGGGSTENHALMLRTARYLATQTWPDATFASDASNDKFPNDVTGEERMLDRMTLYTHEGTVEFDSDTYLALYAGPLRSLADLATDSLMRNRANLTFEWLLVENANQWLDGHYSSSSFRKKSPYSARNAYGAGEVMLWLYFGGPEPVEWFVRDGVEAHNAVQLAVSDYRLPSIIGELNQQPRPYTHREADRWGYAFYYHTTYMSQSYALYSSYESYPVHQRFNDQYHRWGLDFLTDLSAPSSLYLRHPHPDNPDFGKNSYGATGYEQVLQQNGTLVGVYNIPTDDPKPYVAATIPPAYVTSIDHSSEGRIYLHYDSVMVALYMTAPYNWNDGMETFTCTQPQVGFVLETALPTDYPGTTAQQQLESFEAATLPTFASVLFTTEASPNVQYTSLAGDQLAIEYQGERRINGTALDLSGDWPLLDNPWVRQARQDGILEIELDGQVRTYDFDQWTVQQVAAPEQPAPPTGPSSTSSVDEQGYLLRNGERFFPVGSYGLSFRIPIEERKRALRIVGEAGFNFAYLSAIFQDRYEELLNLADSLGVSVLGGLTKLEEDTFDQEVRQSVARYRDYPALLGWQLIDDGDDAWELERDSLIATGVPGDLRWTLDDIQERNQLVKQADATHITYQTLTGYTLARRQALERYAPLSDAFALQIYPIEPLTDYDVTDTSALAQTYYRTLRYVQVAEANGQPMILNAQTFAWPTDSTRSVSNPDARYPTPEELRNMLYTGLAAGIKGILTFDFSFDLYDNQRPLWDEFVAISSDILAYEEFYLEGELTRLTPPDTGGSPVVASYYEYQDQLLLIVANTDAYQSQQVDVTLPDGYSAGTPVAERMSATLALDSNQVSGTLDSAAVQVYRFTRTSPPTAEGTVVIRAKGDCGLEIMELHVDGIKVAGWTVSTSFADYTYADFTGGDVTVHFRGDNFGQQDPACQDANLEVDYLEVCGTTYPTETAATKPTTDCCPWDPKKLYSDGGFNFGTIDCTSSASVSSLPFADMIRAYPNPTSEELTVVGGQDYQASLYDLMGGLLMQHHHLQGQATLDVSHLRPGVYLLKLQEADGTSAQQRLIVQ